MVLFSVKVSIQTAFFVSAFNFLVFDITGNQPELVSG